MDMNKKDNKEQNKPDIFTPSEDLAQKIASHYRSSLDKEAPEIKQANLIQINQESAELNKKDEIISRQGNFGGKSDSWFQMTDKDINDKFYWSTQLNKAKTPEERKNASYQMSQADKKITASVGSIKALEEWKQTYLPEKTGKKNVIGGTYTGAPTTYWSQEVYKNQSLKDMLLGGYVGSSGELYPEPTYFQEFDRYDQPVLMAFVDGYIEPFNVMNTINQDAPTLNNWSKEIQPIVSEMELLSPASNGFNPSFIDETKTEVIDEKSKDGNKTIRKTVQYLDQKKSMEFQRKLAGKAIGLSGGGSALGLEEYNDLNITYLQYASKLNNEKKYPKKDLDYVGNYRLTPESSGLVEASFIDWGKANYLPGYQEDKNIYSTSNTEEIVASSAPETIGTDVKLLPHQKNKA